MVVTVLAFMACSGAMNAGVPMSSPVTVRR